MPSLDIATVQPSLQTHLVPLGAQSILHAKTLPNPWKSSQFLKKANIYGDHLHVRRGKLLIKAVATLETKCPVQKEDEQRNSHLFVSSKPSKDQNETVSEDKEQLDEREMLRRMRISKANKGNTPWNKGRKHSPETLQKIRERTKLAMQNPKVKMKLMNLGHAQSEETKLKIGVGVKMGWGRRKERQVVQETCHFEWQNMIAEAARRGYTGEEEFQWESYKILDEQLKNEWLESAEQRKTMPRVKGSKRAPKSPEQRRKIAEAIVAKWADPEYRERVCSALAKYHGTPVGAERKPNRKQSVGTDSTKRNLAKKSTSDSESSPGIEHRIQIQQLRLRKRNTPVYRDPLASSKLEMIKNIRAQRAAAESKKVEAIKQARVLIAEAAKAAQALEVAAAKSLVAQASLLESRKLIAEATQMIESLESGHITSDENATESENGDTNNEILGQVNGPLKFPLSGNAEDFASRTSHPLSSSSHSLPTFNLDRTMKLSANVEPNGNTKHGKSPLPNGTKIHPSEPIGDIDLTKPLINGKKVQAVAEKNLRSKPLTVTKKWVCGRHVEVTEGA